MKKTIQIMGMLGLLIIILFIGSCQKTGSLQKEQLPNTKLVPKDLAKQVAEKFNPLIFSKDLAQSNQTKIVTNTIMSDLIYNDKTGQPALYVFNFNKGFVFVSADFSLRPILAYIDNGSFDKNKMPEGLQDWINKTIENIEVVRKGLYDNSKNGAMAWNRYLIQKNIIAPSEIQSNLSNGDPCIEPNLVNPKGTTTNSLVQFSSYVVGPLLPVTWGQDCSYNDLCAIGQAFTCAGCGTDRPLTGCVATSMSQIIRFHQFPNTYNYAAMPATFGNVQVQRLMRDAGLSVNMNYGCAASGAFGNAVVPALKNTFGYSSANRNSYNATSSYINVRNNINNGLPVLLEGRDQNINAGHEWVADGITENTYTECGEGGYSVTYLYFHMNWGWHELGIANDFNGWFAFDNWFISGRNLNFSYARYSVTEIHP
jgi:Peptidase C10 family/Spi protease inhibitor